MKGGPDEPGSSRSERNAALPRTDRRSARDEKRASDRDGVAETRRGARGRFGSIPRGQSAEAFAAFFGPPMDAFKRGGRPDEGRGRPKVTAPTRTNRGKKPRENVRICEYMRGGTRIERPGAFSVGNSRART